MIEVNFQEALDAQMVYKRLSKAKLNKSIKYIEFQYNQEQSNSISIFINNKKEKVISNFLIPVLTNYMIECKEDSWLLSIIENDFYFTDYEEQYQILQIAHALIEGQYEDIPESKDLVSREELLKSSLLEFIEDPISFSFESFVKFRLREYGEQLYKIIELAIDEYKLEQEYQNFIQNLRDFTAERKPKLEKLHILHDEQFLFFNESFIEMKQSEMIKFIDRKLVLNHPMYIDSTVIAPLVSISPDSISIYTNEIDHGMIQTIQNVFLERVKIYSKHYFDQVKLQKKI